MGIDSISNKRGDGRHLGRSGGGQPTVRARQRANGRNGGACWRCRGLSGVRGGIDGEWGYIESDERVRWGRPREWTAYAVQEATQSARTGSGGPMREPRGGREMADGGEAQRGDPVGALGRRLAVGEGVGGRSPGGQGKRHLLTSPGELLQQAGAFRDLV